MAKEMLLALLSTFAAPKINAWPYKNNTKCLNLVVGGDSVIGRLYSNLAQDEHTCEEKLGCARVQRSAREDRLGCAFTQLVT